MRIFRVDSEEELSEIHEVGQRCVGISNYSLFTTCNRVKFDGPFAIYFWRSEKEKPVCIHGMANHALLVQLQNLLGYGVLFCVKVSSDGFTQVWFE